MALLNRLPQVQGPGIAGLVGAEVAEIVTTFNLESLDAVNVDISKDNLWASQGSRVTPAVGSVKVPIRFLSSQTVTPFKPGGQRDYGTTDVGVIVVPTSMNQLNYKWVIMPDANGNTRLMSIGDGGTYEDFYGAAGLAEAMIVAGHDYKANLVASVVYESITDAASGITASMLGIPEIGSPLGLPLFSNGTDSALHKAHPKMIGSPTFETLFRPGITNRVGFTGGAFDSSWLEKMVLAMTQVPHPSRPNRTMGLEVTDIVGPTWMKIPFWRAAVSNLILQTSTVGATGVAAGTSNIFNAKTIEEMGADKFIGAGGVAPQRYWTSSLLDNHPYFTNNSSANMTSGPGGGPAHMALAISNQRPRVQNWCELAMRDEEGTPYVQFFGPGDPQSQESRMVRLIGDYDGGARPGLPHFANLWLGV